MPIPIVRIKFVDYDQATEKVKYKEIILREAVGYDGIQLVIDV